MKAKISVSIDEETLVKMRERLREGSFRNKSHLIEYAVKFFLGSETKNG